MCRTIRLGQSSVNANPLTCATLGPGRSLLLINGHRVSDYRCPTMARALANYNNFPRIVDRIEGSPPAPRRSTFPTRSPACHVILNKDIDGDTFRARYGNQQRGRRAVRDVSWSGGKTARTGA